jgi:hypothetical protein
MQVLKQRTARALPPKRKRRNPRQRTLFADEPKHAFWQARSYDFNVWTVEEARGEAQVYASQSGEAGIGRSPRGIAMEQLSFLFPKRSRAAERESRLDGNLVSESCGMTDPIAQAFRTPGRGTHFSRDANETRGTGHAPGTDPSVIPTGAGANATA